jgi:CHASE2 domain-containing sensor protein
MARIFVSYRRDDAGKTAWRLFDWLERQFGATQVFFDREGIAGGDRFPEVLAQQLAACEVLIALIGPRWLDIADAQGQRRLWQPQDYVAHEISTALERGIRVVPLLVDGARMPAREALPPALAALAERQALAIEDAHFRDDFEELVDVVEQRPRRWRERERDRALRLVRYARRSSLVLPLVVAIAFLAAWVRLFGLWGIDTQIASYLLGLSGGLTPVASEQRVAVIAIDERTEADLGRRFGPVAAWRRDHALLIDRLSAAGAAAVGFDIYMERETEFDAELVRAVRLAGERGTRVVFGVQAMDGERPRLAPALVEAGVEWGLLCLGSKRGYLYTAPLARALPEAETGSRAACSRADRPPLALITAFGGRPAEVCRAQRSLTLSDPGGRLRHVGFSEMQQLRSTQKHCPPLARGDDVATSLLLLSPLDYWRRAPQRHSYSEMLDPRRTLPERSLAGRVFVVGVTTARDEHDIERGLWREERPGVELHADALRNLLAGFAVRPLQPAGQFGVMLAAALLGACLRFVTLHGSRARRVGLLAGAALAYAAACLVLSSSGILLVPMYDIVAFALAWRLLGRLERRADAVSPEVAA